MDYSQLLPFALRTWDPERWSVWLRAQSLVVAYRSLGPPIGLACAFHVGRHSYFSFQTGLLLRLIVFTFDQPVVITDVLEHLIYVCFSTFH